MDYSYTSDEEDDDFDSVTVASKTSTLNGHAIVVFRMVDFVRFGDRKRRYDLTEGTERKQFTVKGEIIDELTGCSEIIERVIHVHKDPFQIKIDKDVFEYLAKGSKCDVKVCGSYQPIINRPIIIMLKYLHL